MNQILTLVILVVPIANILVLVVPIANILKHQIIQWNL